MEILNNSLLWTTVSAVVAAIFALKIAYQIGYANGEHFGRFLKGKSDD
jgi:hypothetical protein